MPSALPGAWARAQRRWPCSQAVTKARLRTCAAPRADLEEEASPLPPFLGPLGFLCWGWSLILGLSSEAELQVEPRSSSSPAVLSPSPTGQNIYVYIGPQRDVRIYIQECMHMHVYKYHRHLYVYHTHVYIFAYLYMYFHTTYTYLYIYASIHSPGFMHTRWLHIFSYPRMPHPQIRPTAIFNLSQKAEKRSTNCWLKIFEKEGHLCWTRADIFLSSFPKRYNVTTLSIAFTWH